MKRKRLFNSKKGLGQYLLTTLFVLLFCSIGAQAQELIVTGVIVSETDNLPIPGVSVTKKGTSVGTITNIDGKYSIKAIKGDVLVFRFIGMQQYEATVSDPRLDVTMKSELISLNEVIAIGYGSQKKKEVTGAVAHVSSETISKTVTSDLGAALQGQVAGVNVVASSGAPGAQAEVLIRGISSLSGNTPLYVVDGVPQIGNPGISPSEIESLDILKDAASCAIYGVEGAAGVILITTKQGKEGSLKVSVNASYGIQDIRSSTPVMNSVEDTYFKIIESKNRNPGTNDNDANLSLVKSPKSFQYDTNINDDVFVDNAAVQDYNINISGGSKSITYSVVAGYFGKVGSIVNSDFNRFNTRANTTYKMGKWNIQASLALTTEQKQAAPGGIITQTIKYMPTQAPISPDNSGQIVTIGGDDGKRVGWVTQSLQNTDDTNNTRALANLNVDYEIVKGLNISTRFGYNVFNSYRKRFAPFQDVITIWDDPVTNNEDSYVRNDAIISTGITSESGLRYQAKFGKHKITAQGIFSIKENRREQFYARREGVLDNSISVLNGTSINSEVGSGTDYVNKQIGTLARILYNYKGKYSLNVSGRYDGSSRFAEENRWGFFPSVSAAWNISDEGFWSPLTDFSNGVKLRVSRGTVGNNRIPDYSYSASVTSQNYAFGPEGSNLSQGMTQTSFGNPYASWETSVMYNLGLDMAFFKNKLTFSAEYYHTEKEDMLFPINLPGSTSGVSNAKVTLNVGDMTNTGYEFAIGWRDHVGKLNYGINGTFTTNENKITKMISNNSYELTDDSGLIAGAKETSQITALAEGYEAGAFFVYTTDGIVDTHQKLAEYQKLVPSAQMGDLIYKDNNGDGQIGSADRVYVGSGLPEYEIGCNLSADYKGIDLSIQMYAAIGHEIMNGSKATAFGWGRHKDLLYQYSESNPVTPIPAYMGDAKSASQNYRGYTDLWLEDGSYLRIRNITLGYSFSQKALSKVGISKARFFVNAQNPFTITKYTGYDPEIGGNINSKGLDKGNYPVTAVYSIGMNLNF
ncbi:SusC/RagA family TonB-linked outer membrane protein [Saccharicrinis aurantiacus]|uniref:SusC/RagA family TonB-linked outer membrane protein n=1 Tax=Saccharicrinis aurantiacus TaxID=1849719 RepID=UPI00094FEACA|nr:TonB-dependent receptor [Saccharicrinis aurantiacus]